MPTVPDNWPFEDSPNVAVITTRSIIKDKAPILLVTHDEDDGTWQFLPGGQVRDEDVRIVALRQILDLDPGLAELADLPEGCVASRATPAGPWQRRPRNR